MHWSVWKRVLFLKNENNFCQAFGSAIVTKLFFLNQGVYFEVCEGIRSYRLTLRVTGEKKPFWKEDWYSKVGHPAIIPRRLTPNNQYTPADLEPGFPHFSCLCGAPQKGDRDGRKEGGVFATETPDLSLPSASFSCKPGPTPYPPLRSYNRRAFAGILIQRS